VEKDRGIHLEDIKREAKEKEEEEEEEDDDDDDNGEDEERADRRRTLPCRKVPVGARVKNDFIVIFIKYILYIIFIIIYIEIFKI